MYSRRSLEQIVTLPADRIGPNVNEHLLAFVRKSVEGKCIAAGYVKPGSVTLVTCSMGRMDTNAGSAKYLVKYQADVLFPTDGLVFPCKVHKVTKMGILGGVDGESPSSMDVLVPRDHYLESAAYQALQPDSVFEARVLGHKFHHGDRSMFVLAEIVESVAAEANRESPLESDVATDGELGGTNGSVKTISVFKEGSGAGTDGGNGAAASGSVKVLTVFPSVPDSVGDSAGTTDLGLGLEAKPIRKRIAKPAIA